MPSKYSLGQAGENKYEHSLPSGSLCLMKDADLSALIAAGAVDNADSLTSLVQTEHVDRVKKGKKSRHLQAKTPGAGDGLTAEGVLEIMADPKRWQPLERLINAVVVTCVLEPQVLPVPEAEKNPVPEGYERPEAGDGKVYVDRVDLLDRLSVFARAMGPLMGRQEAMASFRQGSAEAVAGVGPEQDVRDTPQHSAGGS